MKLVNIWKTGRLKGLAKVDMNILRMAIYEICLVRDIPR